MTARSRVSLFFWLVGLVAANGMLSAAEPAAQAPNAKGDAGQKEQASPAAPAKIEPKALADYTQKGLGYLVNQQDSSGGWGQGGGWRQGGQGGRVEGKEVKDPPDVGNTCAAALALVRAGSTPKNGKYADNIAKAFNFVCDHVEQADSASMYVTDVRDTQLQHKIGSYVDTFLTALLLSELKGKMAKPQDEVRLAAALKKTIAKIEKNQQTDGTFAGNAGWASVLSQSVCAKALNRAAQNGVAVKKETLERDYSQAIAGLDVKKGEFKLAGDIGGTAAGSTGSTKVGAGATTATGAGSVTLGGTATLSVAKPTYAGGTTITSGTLSSAPSDAGVEIYSAASTASRISEKANTNIKVTENARKVLADDKASAPAKAAANSELADAAKVAEVQTAAIDGIVRKLDDKRFLAGFGNNGGEEFLSYMNLSETLRTKGGTEWLAWDKGVSENLHRVQNQDGSWSGDHCITGRTFCTAAALLTLMADRAPLPIADSIKGKKN
jgi:hypothetical protein